MITIGNTNKSPSFLILFESKIFDLNMRFSVFLFVFLFSTVLFKGFSQSDSISIQILDNEKWWGASVGLGSEMPFVNKLNLIDLSTTNFNNQTVPFLISSNGRYVWSDFPFQFNIESNILHIKSANKKLNVSQSGETLKSAFLDASKNHFPPSGHIPDSLFFTKPTYNTWIELTYNQNQKDILNYAHQIIKNQFPAGILMIDDNWQKYYGNFEFKPDKFPNPKLMVNQLHKLGFKVLLWVCPFISPDSPEFRLLREKGYLLKLKNNNPAIISWWNGNSACLDLTNPEVIAYMKNKLQSLQKEYGIDGFKFDAGDTEHFRVEYNFFNKNASSVTMSENWAKLGLNFPFNEYRACWKMGGEALIQRLSDKSYSWNSLKLLIPEMLTAGILGYAYTCPDMIGGGEFHSFQNITATNFDQRLIIRSAQIQALMPMMQFSVAPWRILSTENMKICRQFALLHQKFGNYLLQNAKESSKTGEPIVRYLEYAFPHQGFSNCNDQFMLGEKYLVAPILTNENTRKVILPKGIWRDDLGRIYKGDSTITVEVGLERLPYFERIQN